MNKGYTITEMLIVISIIGTLSMIGLSSYSNALKQTRDAKRVNDMQKIYGALEQYKLDHNGDLPNETYTNLNVSGWEVSADANFMEYLQPYTHATIVDPLNRLYSPVNMPLITRPSDGNLFYMYYYYNWPAAGQYYGCDFNGPFAVLGFRSLELSANKGKLPKAQCGQPPSPPAICPFGPSGGYHLGASDACRDWSNEFDYSVIIRP